MPKNEGTKSESYDRAREMTEKALDAYVEGDEKTGAKLVDQAKSVNESAVRDVHQELEEDANSEHDPDKLSRSVAKKSPDSNN
jgi:alpha-galactosidase